MQIFANELSISSLWLISIFHHAKISRENENKVTEMTDSPFIAKIRFIFILWKEAITSFH